MLSSNQFFVYQITTRFMQYRQHVMFIVVLLLLMLSLFAAVPVFAEGGTGDGVCSGC